MKRIMLQALFAALFVLAFSSTTVLADGGGPEPTCIPPFNCPGN